MVYKGYMVRYIVGLLVSYNHFNIYGYCVFNPRFMKCIWYSILLVSV